MEPAKKAVTPAAAPAGPAPKAVPGANKSAPKGIMKPGNARSAVAAAAAATAAAAAAAAAASHSDKPKKKRVKTDDVVSGSFDCFV